MADRPPEDAPGRILSELSSAIVGKTEVLETTLLAVLSGGHVLIEDYPGLAKTLMAKSLASALGLEFKRVQFTPDLLPADITGSYVLDRRNSTFELRKGPIFTNMLLADEINRAPPRTQSALLEAMQEKQVTIEGDTLKLDSPFIVIATQNPIEYEGTYPLPEAQLDRFLVKTAVGYPTHEEEVQILKNRNAAKSDLVTVKRAVTREELLLMQSQVEEIYVDDAVASYIVELVGRTREHRDVEVGSSPRGSLAVMKLAKSRAYLNRRSYVVPDDVKAVAVPALSHRLVLKAEEWIRGKKAASIIEEVLQSVPVPKIG
jgi:MoxR-like ATPase